MPVGYTHTQVARLFRSSGRRHDYGRTLVCQNLRASGKNKSLAMLGTESTESISLHP